MLYVVDESYVEYITRYLCLILFTVIFEYVSKFRGIRQWLALNIGKNLNTPFVLQKFSPAMLLTGK